MNIEQYGELQLHSVNYTGRSNSVKRAIQDENTRVSTAVKIDKHPLESVIKFGMLEILLNELTGKKNLRIISF